MDYPSIQPERCALHRIHRVQGVGVAVAILAIYCLGSSHLSQRACGSDAVLYGAQRSTTMRLFQIDSSSGVVSQPNGAVLRIGPKDLASAPSFSNDFWAVTVDFFGEAGNELINIDVANESVVSRTSIDYTEDVLALAMSPLNGRLYGFANNSQLLAIDSATGDVTEIGMPNEEVPVNGLAFDNDGTLYGAGYSTNSSSTELFAIDVVNGTTDLVARFDIGVGDIAFDPADNTLFAIGANDGSYQLFELDLQSESTITIGDSLIRSSGLAFAMVPEPSGAILFAVTFGFLALSRRQRAL